MRNKRRRKIGMNENKSAVGKSLPRKEGTKRGSVTKKSSPGPSSVHGKRGSLRKGKGREGGEQKTHRRARGDKSIVD